jgi:hypothetical protein
MHRDLLTYWRVESGNFVVISRERITCSPLTFLGIDANCKRYDSFSGGWVPNSQVLDKLIFAVTSDEILTKYQCQRRRLGKIVGNQIHRDGRGRVAVLNKIVDHIQYADALIPDCDWSHP